MGRNILNNGHYVNHLLDESGFFILPTELINEFNLKCTYLLTSLWYYMRINRRNQRLQSLVNG